MMTKIAVILPTYIPKEYIVKCFDSLDSQSLSNSEYCVYIGLNGPRDDNETFVKSCLGKFSFNYKYFYLSTAGVSHTRNALIEESKEDYIVFLDDDDEITSNYLENLLSVSTPTTMGIANVMNFIGERNNISENYIGKSFKKLASKGSSLFVYRKYFSSPCAKMLHRKMIGNARFDTKLARGEDGLFMATISNNIDYIAKCSSDTIYYVNYRQNSASRKKVDRRNESKKLIYLVKKYTSMLFFKGYNSAFIATRILATLNHLKKLY